MVSPDRQHHFLRLPAQVYALKLRRWIQQTLPSALLRPPLLLLVLSQLLLWRLLPTRDPSTRESEELLQDGFLHHVCLWSLGLEHLQGLPDLWAVSQEHCHAVWQPGELLGIRLSVCNKKSIKLLLVLHQFENCSKICRLLLMKGVFIENVYRSAPEESVYNKIYSKNFGTQQQVIIRFQVVFSLEFTYW